MRRLSPTPTSYELSISIHAPLAGCDKALTTERAEAEISIHAPLAGCDRPLDYPASFCREFQSTHPLRGATARAALAALHNSDFNPRTPCGVRLPHRAVGKAVCGFQSTRPLRGATCSQLTQFFSRYQFQSTRPLRGATLFTSTSPKACSFQSTRPLRGATTNAGYAL